MRVVFYDAVSGGNQVGSQVDSNSATQSDAWEVLFISTPVPPGAKSLELLLLGDKVTAGTRTDAGFDDVSGILLVAP